MISKYKIIEEQWEKGSKKNKQILKPNILLIESFAYNCMEELEEKLTKQFKEKAKKIIDKQWGENSIDGNYKDLIRDLELDVE